MNKIFYKRKLCLFINSGGVLKKLLEEPRVAEYYRFINYNFCRDKKPISYIVNKLNIKIIVIELSKIREYRDDIIRELIQLRTEGIMVYEAENFFEIVNRRVSIVRLSDREYLGDTIFFIKMRKRYRYIKRFSDLIFVFVLTPIALPLVLLGFLLTKISSKGSGFFSQIRVGKNGKEFVIYKIRTMNAVSNNNGGFTQPDDERITSVGKFLRLTKIDELPQLYNILRGDMSMIGPRPERPEYVHQYNRINPFFNLRHIIKPGVSGWAQIHIPKATPEDNLKKLEYDLYYIKRYSWSLDLKILFETIRIILRKDSN